MSCNTDICGEWEDEQETTTGQCNPRRLKRSCDGPIAYLNDTAETCMDTCPEGLVGEPITVTIGIGEVNSPFSTANANELAASLACQRAAALRALTPCLYPNEEQECTDSCPEGYEGEPITVVISAGDPRFNALTQAQANALALAAACEEAAALRADTPCGGVAAQMEFSFESILRECSLCGFAEFASPSTPPKLYTICAFSGAHFGTHYNVSGTFGNPIPWQCEDGVETGTFTGTFSGSARLENCEVVETALQQIIQEPGEDLDVYWSEPHSPAPSCTYTIIDTQTTRVITGTEDCCITSVDGFGFPFGALVVSGVITQVLSAEDTEANAIARATPVLGTSNIAFYQPRTSFDFDYQTVEISIDITVLTSGLTYRVTVPITTENYGGGSPVITNMTYEFTAGGASFNITDEFIADHGKQITIGSPTIEII